MRIDRRLNVLLSVRAALTSVRENAALHCNAQAQPATHLQGGQATNITHVFCLRPHRIMLSQNLWHAKSMHRSAGFQRGAIKPRVVPFQISLQIVCSLSLLLDQPKAIRKQDWPNA